MESIFEKIGLKLTRKIRVACPFYYGSHEEAIKSFLGTGPAAAAIEMNGRDIVEQTISEAISPFRLIDDLHFLQNQFLVFIAEK